MYGWERLVLLKHLVDHGLSKAAIARQLGVSRRSIYHWITTGQLERDLTGGGHRVGAGRPTKLAPYTAIITTRLATYPERSPGLLRHARGPDHLARGGPAGRAARPPPQDPRLPEPAGRR